MNIRARAHGLEMTDELEAHVDRRFRFSLTRFGDRIRRVAILIEDVNGPRGGRDIRCKARVILATRRRPDLVVTERHEDPFAAVSRAAERVSHGVARRLERLHARRRGSTPRLLRSHVSEGPLPA